MYYTIYKTTNLLNDKFYIGKHQTKDLNDGYIGSGKLLKNAIAKHGIENFHKEILYICKSEKHMNILEKILVVPDSEINYNLCQGGYGGWNFVNENLPVEKRLEISKKGGQKTGSKLRGGKNPRLSEFLKQIHAAGLIKYDTFKDRKHSNETKNKMRKSKNQGQANPQYGTKWITNGAENRKIKKDDPLPIGWCYGRK